MIQKGRTNDVMLGFVDNGNVATCFMSSVLNAFAEDAARGDKRRMVEYYYATGPYIADNRSRVVRYFLECTNKQWLWMLDNDMKFPINALYKLLAAAEEYDCKILGAAYWNQYPGTNVYLSWLAFTPQGILAIQKLPDDRTTPLEITATGMGCTILHRSVLQDVADMYPNDPYDTFANDMLVQFEDGGFLVGRTPEDMESAIKDRKVEGMQRMGEDVSFCLRARRAGHLTWGLPSLEVDHYKPHFMSHGNQITNELASEEVGVLAS